jgi:hypothetical protein
MDISFAVLGHFRDHGRKEGKNDYIQDQRLGLKRMAIRHDTGVLRVGHEPP